MDQDNVTKADIDSKTSQRASNPWAAGATVLLGGALGCLVAVFACVPKPDPNQEERCNSCTSGKKNWQCTLDIQNQATDQYVVVCAEDNDDLINVECNAACLEWSANSNNSPCVGYDNPHHSFQCLDTPSSTEGDPPWSPSSYVSHTGGVYYVDADLVEQLKSDASLLQNDDAWLESTSTYWRFRDVYSGSLAWQLGFRSGDYVQKVNGTTIRTLSGLLKLMNANYGSNWFTVQIKRGTSTLTFSYAII